MEGYLYIPFFTILDSLQILKVELCLIYSINESCTQKLWRPLECHMAGSKKWLFCSSPWTLLQCSLVAEHNFLDFVTCDPRLMFECQKVGIFCHQAKGEDRWRKMFRVAWNAIWNWCTLYFFHSEVHSMFIPWQRNTKSSGALYAKNWNPTQRTWHSHQYMKHGRGVNNADTRKYGSW